jgi:hypothetical protein
MNIHMFQKAFLDKKKDILMKEKVHSNGSPVK